MAVAATHEPSGQYRIVTSVMPVIPIEPGPYQPPAPAVTTTVATTIPVAAYETPRTVRVTSTVYHAPVTTAARVTTTVPVSLGSCGGYPYTACIPNVGNRATWICVISHESGGNPRAVEPTSGAGGLFQFLATTWRGLGFAGVAQNAAIALQVQAAAKLYLQSGFSPWHGDGCV